MDEAERQELVWLRSAVRELRWAGDRLAAAANSRPPWWNLRAWRYRAKSVRLSASEWWVVRG